MLGEGRKSKLSRPTPLQTGWISPTSPRSSRRGARSYTAAYPPGSNGAGDHREPAGPTARVSGAQPTRWTMGAAHGKKVMGQFYSGLLKQWRDDGEGTICSRGVCFALHVLRRLMAVRD